MCGGGDRVQEKEESEARWGGRGGEYSCCRGPVVSCLTNSSPQPPHTPRMRGKRGGMEGERGAKKKNSVWDQTLWNPLGWKQQGRTKKGKENIKYDKKREINLKRTRRLDGHGGTIRLFGWECVCVCVLAGAELCNRFKLLGFMGVCAVQCSFPETPRREWQNVQHQRV